MNSTKARCTNALGEIDRQRSIGYIRAKVNYHETGGVEYLSRNALNNKTCGPQEFSEWVKLRVIIMRLIGWS